MHVFAITHPSLTIIPADSTSDTMAYSERLWIPASAGMKNRGVPDSPQPSALLLLLFRVSSPEKQRHSGPSCLSVPPCPRGMLLFQRQRHLIAQIGRFQLLGWHALAARQGSGGQASAVAGVRQGRGIDRGGRQAQSGNECADLGREACTYTKPAHA